MVRTSYATENHNTPNKSVRNPGPPPRYIVLHHAAMFDFDALVRLMNGGKQVSATVGVKGRRVASMMDEWPFRGWSLSNARWDSMALTSETCNSTGAPNWLIADDTYDTLASIVAEWCLRYSIPCTRQYILGHREVFTRHGVGYATACPGGMDLDRLVREARAKLGAMTASSGGTPITLLVDRSNNVETIHREKTGDIFNIVWQGIKHLSTGGQAAVSAAVQYADDKPHVLNEQQFLDFIDAYAVPRTQVFRLTPGVPVGHVWSAEHDIKALHAEQKVRDEALMKQNAAILAAITAKA